MDISVKTGVETCKIRDEHDNIIGQFDFNPTDTNMFMRYQTVSKAFSDFNVEKVLTEEDGITKADDFVREQFDFLFGYKVSEGIFGQTGPFTLNKDGTLFFANMLDAIGNIVKKSTEQRIKKIDAQVQKATARYNK